MLKPKKSTRNSEQKNQAITELTKTETKRLNVNVPEDLYKQFKVASIYNGTNMNSIILELVTDYVAKFGRK